MTASYFCNSIKAKLDVGSVTLKVRAGTVVLNVISYLSVMRAAKPVLQGNRCQCVCIALPSNCILRE